MRWGEIEDTHRAFVERFLELLPLADAGFAIGEEAEEPWHEEYTYQHVLARRR